MPLFGLRRLTDGSRVRTSRERPDRRRQGVGWLGAGRVLAGLSAALVLVGVGFVGLRAEVLGQRGPVGLVGAGAEPQLIPGVQAGEPFTGGASPGSDLAGARSRATAPLSPSAGATPLSAGATTPSARHVATAGGGALQVVAGGEDPVASAPPVQATLRDTDRDGVPDAVERRLGLDPQRSDTDGDGMPDGWELRFGFNPRNDLDANGDPDHDGVSNVNEYRVGSDPRVADSNHDGVTDGRDDADRDGLPNAVEQRLGLDPSQQATPPRDRDLTRTARAVDAPAPTSDVQAAGDVAVQPATVGDRPTDGALDSDGDGLPNALEVKMGLDPTKADSDGDGVADGLEDYDGDGLPNAIEPKLGLDPTKADTNGDGTPDGRVDSDGDGLSNRVELALRLDPAVVDTDGNGVPDGQEDTDDDGMSNAAELAVGRDPATPDQPAAPIVDPAPVPAPVAPAPAAPAPADPVPAPAPPPPATP